MEHRVGTVFGAYRIDRELGRGGMSIVYEAFDEGLGRTVALKVMAPWLSSDGAYRARFSAEARAASSVDHPNVVPIFQGGEQDGQLYLAMRYVRGSDLRALLVQKTRLQLPASLSFLTQTADALDAVHAHRLVHRDIKPENLLVDPSSPRAELGHVYVTDFGIAQVDTTTMLTATGQVLGTVAYASPEQISGDPTHSRSDIYSLACVMFECLTGGQPFARDNPAATLYAHVHDPRPTASNIVPGLPPALDAVLAHAMAVDPDDRFATCGEFQQAFAAAVLPATVKLDGPPTAIEPTDPTVPLGSEPTERQPEPLPTLEPVGRRSRGPRRALVVAVAAFVLIAIAVGAVLTSRSRNASRGSSSASATSGASGTRTAGTAAGEPSPNSAPTVGTIVGPTVAPTAAPPAAPPTEAPSVAPRSFPFQIANSCITSCGGIHKRTIASSTSPAVGDTLDQGETIYVVCQATGEPVTNDKHVTTSVWNQLVDGTWVPDAFVNTPGLPAPGIPGFSPNIPKC